MSDYTQDPQYGQNQQYGQYDQNPQYGQGPQYGQNPQYGAGTRLNGMPGIESIPPEYKPISMWGYFGYTVLFMIPIIGFIIAIVFSFTAKNKNVRNFARSQFCWIIVLFVLLLLFGSMVIPFLYYL